MKLSIVFLKDNKIVQIMSDTTKKNEPKSFISGAHAAMKGLGFQSGTDYKLTLDTTREV